MAGDPNGLELIAALRVSSRWAYTTADDLLAVLSPNYFGERFLDHGIQRLDRIELLCESNAPLPVFAVLCVDEVVRPGRDRPPGLRVSLLDRLERLPVSTLSVDAHGTSAPQGGEVRITVRDPVPSDANA